MKKSNYRSYICKGVNNSISLLKSNRFIIENITILKGGRAQKNKKLKTLLNDKDVFVLDKNEFYKQFSDERKQDIIIQFSGELVKKTIPDFKNRKNVCLLALDRIEDPQNFGQIIRTAECGGINGIIFSKHHSAPITETVLKVSQGAFTNINIYEVTNLKQSINQLKKNDFWIIGLENQINSKPWYAVDYSPKTVIVLGSEGKGMRKTIMQTCDFIATIPMQGNTGSLNVSASASAVIFERLRQKMEDR